MLIHQIKLEYPRKSRRRVGRGGKKGTYCGRGVKGQKARSGKGPRPGFAGGDTTFIKRLPKQKGQVGKLKKAKKGVKLSRYQARLKEFGISMDHINKNFADKKKSLIISPKTLLKKGLLSKIKGEMPSVKIVGGAKPSRSYIFKGVSLSQSARINLEDAASKKAAKKASLPKKESKKKK